MLNEPFGDEALQISPLYEDVAARIRKHDQKAILFIEPQVLSSKLSCWHMFMFGAPGATRVHVIVEAVNSRQVSWHPSSLHVKAGCTGCSTQSGQHVEQRWTQEHIHMDRKANTLCV